MTEEAAGSDNLHDKEPVPADEDTSEIRNLSCDPLIGMSLHTQALNEQLRSHCGLHETPPEVLDAICTVLIAVPGEVGIETGESPLRERAAEVLCAPAIRGLPEADVCRLWLACFGGGADGGVADAFVGLAEMPLWEPVQCLVYRALTHFGRRRTLAGLLPQDGPLSLYQADAWLEAMHTPETREDWTDRIAVSQSDVLSAACQDQWLRLLKAEAVLPDSNYPQVCERDLIDLSALPLVPQACSYEEAVTARLAARATAALIRLRLAQRSNVADHIESGPAQRLPLWERNYLQALACWQTDDLEEAAASLVRALDLNPHQGCVRVALATVRAPRAPEEALSFLAGAEPSRDVVVARASLLSCLQRYDEADQVLGFEGLHSRCPEAPGRYSWAAGRRESKYHEAALRTALAERRGDFAEARRIIESEVNCGGRYRTVWQARLLRSIQCELGALPENQVWRRDEAELRLKHAYYDVGKAALRGDALFFRAAALNDTEPERAAADFRKLLRQHWARTEQTLGGTRLKFIGDTLLKLGYAEDAARAYKLAGECPAESCDDRLAAAHAYVGILRGKGPEGDARDMEEDRIPAPENPWVSMIAATGALLLRDTAAFTQWMDRAEQRGAPEAIGVVLRAVHDAASGSGGIPEEDLAAAGLPPSVAASMRLVWGAGDIGERVRTYVCAMGHDWLASCPVDPAVVGYVLVGAACDQGHWDEALERVSAWTRAGHPWANQLLLLVRLRRGLALILEGRLDEAERELRTAERAHAVPKA